MSTLFLRAALVVLSLSGCSTIKDTKDSVSGWFGDSTISSGSAKKAAGDSPQLKFGATLRVNKYADQRKVGNPRLLGTAELPVRGIDGKQMLLDQDIADVVTTSIKKRFDKEGYQVLENGNALFEISGTVKELTLNVKSRDEITIAVETTLKEVATGKVIWQGLTTEKNDRFAGISGNNKDDVFAYLTAELRVVSTKTVEAISASLMAAKPELFNLTPGTKPISGVTVFVAPSVAAPAAVAMPVTTAAMPGARAEAPPPAYVPRASATAGLLLVNTNPQRAKVYLDGVYYGLSPLRQEMEPGIYAVSVKMEGYKMVSEKVSVRKGSNTEMELNLER